MTKDVRRWILIGAAAIIVLPVLIYTFDTIRGSGEIARNVTAAGVDLGGLGEEEASEALRVYEAELASQPAYFEVSGTEFLLDPRDVGLEVDEEAVVAEAMEQRRDKGFVAGFFSWFGSFGDQIELDVPVTIDTVLLDDVLDSWEGEAIDSPAYEGGVIIRDTRALPDYPRPGEGIDRDPAHEAVLASVQGIDRELVVLGTAQIQPELTNADIDEATAEAARLIDAPVTLRAEDPEFEVVFSREDLAGALISDVRYESGPLVLLEFDEQALVPLLTPLRPEIEQPPRDAELVIDEEAKEVTLIPSRHGTVLDTALVTDALLEAAARSGNSGEFPYAQGAAPAFTTEDAQALGDIGFVSEFTTSHPAGQRRVTNIHLMADAVDGAIVEPGEEFSLNEFVGQRTTDKGYVPAPMIFNGELVDDVGGGVSQFATTFYNAIFYGCYEPIDHKPHSYYFSRYPEVNEATISWPSPHLIFRNNTDTMVIIKTNYTETDITVQFYGNNGGCVAERQLGSRYAFTQPPEEFEANEDLNPDEQKVTQNGWGGFSNTVKRVMTWPDGTVIEEDYQWTYQPAPKIIEVHPCLVPEEEGEELDTSDCPVEVPALAGWSVADARSALEALGLVLVEGTAVEVNDEAQSGLIVEQSPGGGEWIEPGSEVTVNVAVYVPPPDDSGEET
ncbi:MAG: VanW family protein [Acidimicrobiia bacterium]|nr:VanW family protein [Acidimicrobiia bacterium]